MRKDGETYRRVFTAIGRPLEHPNFPVWVHELLGYLCVRVEQRLSKTDVVLSLCCAVNERTNIFDLVIYFNLK